MRLVDVFKGIIYRPRNKFQQKRQMTTFPVAYYYILQIVQIKELS